MPIFKLKDIDTCEFNSIYLTKSVEALLLSDKKDLQWLVKFLMISPCTTYTTKERVTRQCTQGRRRSISDIFFICKTYFPKVTFKEVFKIIDSIPANGGFCYAIYKYVFNNNGTDKRNQPTEFLNNSNIRYNYNTLRDIVLS